MNVTARAATATPSGVLVILHAPEQSLGPVKSVSQSAKWFCCLPRDDIPLIAVGDSHKPSN
jgi:hypothetical protein